MTTTARKVTNPRTEEQQAHRVGFGLIAKLSSDLKAVHEIGLRKESLRRKGGKRRPTTFSCFKHLNRNCFNADGVDYPHAIVSKGPLAKPDITSVRLSDEGMLTLTFSNRYHSGDPDDELVLAAYCPRLRVCLIADPVPRSAESLTAQLPAGWFVGKSNRANHAFGIHLYAFFLGRKLFTSDSVYIPLPNNRPEHATAIPAPTTAATSDPITSPLTPFDPINPTIDPTSPTFDPIKTTADPINPDPITVKLYRLIRQDGTLTYAGYAQQLGISEATVKRRLQTLKSQGLILRRGSNKTGHWELP